MPRVLVLLAVMSLGATGVLPPSLARPLSASYGEASAQSGNDLFQKALSKERVEGQCAEAIVLYERIVKEFASDRALAAKALVQMGRCYERLGKPDAKRAYERVVHEFADQKANATEAQSRLAVLDGAKPAVSGPTARRLWAGTDVDLEGAVTLDGRYLTFVDWDSGDLAVRDLTTGTKRRLTKSPGMMQTGSFANQSAPSPDGKRVAYSWFNSAAKTFELRVIGMDGGSERIVYSKPLEYVLHVAWMPDGRSVVIHYERADRTHQLAIVSLADGSLRPLRTFDWRTASRISVSPDGRHIAYDFPPRTDSPNRDVFILAADGSAASTVAEHGANDLLPLWTPDGGHIVFVSDRTGTAGLWAVPVVNGKASGPARLIQPTGNLVPLGFSRNASLYYGLMTGSVDVYVATLDPATGGIAIPPRPIAPRVLGSNRRPDWSFDGRFLAYQSDRVPGEGLGTRILSIFSLESGLARELSLPLNYFQRPRWSPDGKTVLVTGSSPAGRNGLYAVDVATGAAAPFVLAEPGVSHYGHSWSPDGSTVFFTSSDDRGSFIAATNVASRKTHAFYRPPEGSGIADASPSPDGRWVAVREGTAVKVISTATGVAREVVRMSPPDNIPAFGGINWRRDGQSLFFVRMSGPRGDARELWKVSIDGGTPEQTGLVMRGLNDVKLHPDGRQIAFTAGEGSDEVWVLENLSFAAPSVSSGTRGQQ